MQGIEAAYRGRINMLGAIFGKAKPQVPKNNGPSLFNDLKRLALKQRRAGRTSNG